MPMCNFTSHSKFATILQSILFAVICLGCQVSPTPVNITSDVYVVLPYDYDSKDDLKWSDYLYTHFRNRGGADAPVYYDLEMENSKHIIFHLDKESKDEFKIEHSEKGLLLKAKDAEIAVWLIHQFLRNVADTDKRFPKRDLPYSILSFNDTVGHFAFKYRDMYTPMNQDQDVRGVFGLHCIENNWGLWGHNLGKAVKDKSDQSIYAMVDGIRNHDQFCFSSEKLYRNIEDYVLSVMENNSENKNISLNFAILPNDNSMVCMCNNCSAAGNTKTSATQAVTKMIRRLANRFKKHRFFTSAYMTTKTVCKDKLPDNVGVIISAIDWLPNTGQDDKMKAELGNRIEAWSEKSNMVYVWDYINNFDDYFTSFPVMKIMQERFKFYRGKKVQGIFLNGSGYDFSSFSDMHTCIFSQLMMNPDLDVELLMKDYFTRTFPVAGEAIANYYCSLIENWKERTIPVPYYGGIDEKLNAYLDEKEFEDFYHEIIHLKNNADEEEAFLLRRLITAFAFTRLEIARHKGYRDFGFAELEGNVMKVKDDVYKWLEIFEDGYKAYKLYNISESGDKSEDYVAGWKKYLLSDKSVESLLCGKELHMTWEKEKQIVTGLTDGELGLPVNYYYGWNIFPYKEMEITIPTEENCLEGNKISMNFFSYPRHKIQLPYKIEIYSDQEVVCSETIKPLMEDGPYLIKWETSLQGKFKKDLKLKIYASNNYHIVIDELLLTR